MLLMTKFQREGSMNRVFDDVYSPGHKVQLTWKSTTPAAGHPDKSSPVQMSRELVLWSSTAHKRSLSWINPNSGIRGYHWRHLCLYTNKDSLENISVPDAEFPLSITRMTYAIDMGKPALHFTEEWSDC